jgi:choline dehydrogenase-like flavoprotein
MDEFDFVVIGGGSAGCVVASRLSERPALTVALLEAGNSGESWVVRTPFAGALMVPTSLNNWAFETVPQVGLGGRRGYQPRGRTLGGSSAINAMVYTRGVAGDYNRWAEQGARGWGWDDVLPYFIKSEGNADYVGPLHGNEGPLAVSHSRTDNPFQKIFVEAARQAGLPLREDFNGEAQEGCGIYQVTQKNGERCSAARAYLHPHMNRRNNLHVECGVRAQKILFEGRRATGVEVEQGGVARTFRARREVIVSAGALQSPQILMLSGIGPAEEARRLGLPIVHAAPGVGGNLQDHPDFVFGYALDDLDLVGLSLGGGVRLLREISRYRRERRGMMTSNFAEAGGFLKTRPDLRDPDIQLHFVVALVENHARTLRLGHGYSCHVCLLRPKSRGSLRLRDADPKSPPLIDPNFLGDPRDVEDMVAGFKLTRSLLDAPDFANLPRRDLYTSEVRDDDDIRAILRRRVDTVYHPVGTCRMGEDENSVVDSILRVRGVDGLRVVDASVMPTLIGGNTNAPTVMIGEKAADMILADLGAKTSGAQGASQLSTFS